MMTVIRSFFESRGGLRLIAALSLVGLAAVAFADDKREPTVKPVGDKKETTASPTPKPSSSTAAPTGKSPSAKPAYETFRIRGRIVWMAEALERRFKIRSAKEARERVLALETAQGVLYPLVEDVRGGSFRKDKRLRAFKDVELVVRRHRGSPMVQVVRLYAHQKDGPHLVDYWCDICAITMYELKACDCCQGPIELRLRKQAVESQPVP